jgi:hypothetical protein
MGHLLPCKKRRVLHPHTFALTLWPRQFLHEGHAVTKSNRFPEHCPFVASLVLRRGSFIIADRRLLALPQLVGTRNPGCTTRSKFPRRIRSLHCSNTHASARLADVLCRRIFNQGFSTVLHPSPVGSPCTCTRAVSTSTWTRPNSNL